MDVLDMLVGGTGRVDVQTGDAGNFAGAVMDGRLERRWVRAAGGWVSAHEVGVRDSLGDPKLLVSPCANMLIVQEVAVLPMECAWRVCSRGRHSKFVEGPDVAQKSPC